MARLRSKRRGLTSHEVDLITDIVNRALLHFPDRDRMDVNMDVTAAHLIQPLRLRDWFEADDFNFIHDIVGIERHLDRQNFTFKDCFSPRFAQ